MSDRRGWAPMERFVERYRDFGVDKFEWRPIRVLWSKRYSLILVRPARGKKQ